MTRDEFMLQGLLGPCLKELKHGPDIEVIDFSNFKRAHDDPDLKGKCGG
jgi:hypothetical protein